MKPRPRLQPGDLLIANRVLREVATMLDATALICAWCARVLELRPGEPVVSHGICAPCEERMMREQEEPERVH